MPLVRYNYSFIKKAEPTGKKLNQLKLYLSDNTTYITKFSAGKADVVQMHADLLNSLSTL
jgi:phage FluMu protein Com